MTCRFRRHWRRDFRGARAIDVSGGRCGALRGRNGSGRYGSVVHLGECGLECRIDPLAGDPERKGVGERMWERTPASGISVSMLGWGRAWLGGSMGSGVGTSGIEWMLSIGGIRVVASGPSGGGFAVSSAIVWVAIGQSSLVIIVFGCKGSRYSLWRIC